MARKKNKEKKRNSMVDVGQESSSDIKSLFSTLTSGFKNTAKIIKSGESPNQQLTPLSWVLIVVCFILMIVFTVLSVI